MRCTFQSMLNALQKEHAPACLDGSQHIPASCPALHRWQSGKEQPSDLCALWTHLPPHRPQCPCLRQPAFSSSGENTSTLCHYLLRQPCTLIWQDRLWLVEDTFKTWHCCREAVREERASALAREDVCSSQVSCLNLELVRISRSV